MGTTEQGTRSNPKYRRLEKENYSLWGEGDRANIRKEGTGLQKEGELAKNNVLIPQGIDQRSTARSAKKKIRNVRRVLRGTMRERAGQLNTSNTRGTDEV